MDHTPSVQFNFQDTIQRTPWLNMSKEALSFKLSASSQHQKSNKKEITAPPKETIIHGRSIARNILQEIKNEQSPTRERIHHIKTDQFFQQFDRVFEVKFESPVKQKTILKGNAKEIEDDTLLLQEVLHKIPSNNLQPAAIKPLSIGRKTGSCQLGQSKKLQNKHKILIRGKHQYSRYEKKEKKVFSNSHTFRPKDIGNQSRGSHQLSVISVQAKEKINFFEKLQIPTIKRYRDQDNCSYSGNVDELSTVLERAHIIKDHFLKSGTLQHWKRKFHQKRLRSRENDITKTVKIRSLGSKHRYTNNRPKVFKQPIKINNFYIPRRNR